MGSSMTRATSSAASIENTSDVERMSNFAKMFVTAALPILIVRFHQVTRQNGLINFKYPVCNDLPSASPLGGLHCLSPMWATTRRPSQPQYKASQAYANTNKEVRRMMWCRTSKGMIGGC